MNVDLTPDRLLLPAAGEPSDGKHGHGNEAEGMLLVFDPHRLEDGPVAEIEVGDHPDQLLFDITKYGIAEAANLPDYPTRMPAIEGVLEDEEIIAILSFIKSRCGAQ